MSRRFPNRHDVTYLEPASHDRIRDQLPVTLPPLRLGAHHGDIPKSGTPSLGPRQQRIERRGEFRRLHMVGVPAKPLVTPTAVGRIHAWFAQTTKPREVSVPDPVPGQNCGKGVAFEVRVASRTRHRSHVSNPVDPVGVQQRQELVGRSRRMADRKQRRMTQTLASAT